MEGLVGYSPWGHKRVGQDLATEQHSYPEERGMCPKHWEGRGEVNCQSVLSLGAGGAQGRVLKCQLGGVESGKASLPA